MFFCVRKHEKVITAILAMQNPYLNQAIEVLWRFVGANLVQFVPYIHRSGFGCVRKSGMLVLFRFAR